MLHIEILSLKMPPTRKRKVGRRRRPALAQRFGGGLVSPIYGESMQVLWHFRPVDFGESLQFQGLERAVYLRTFQML